MSTLSKAKDALVSDYFVVILINKERKDFVLYEENSSRQTGLHENLTALPKDVWYKPLSDGNPHYYDTETDNWLAAKLLDLTGCSNLLIDPFTIEEYDLGYGCWLWRDRRPFQQEDLVHGNLIMDQIGLAIRAFQNKKSARERGDKLAALLELSTAIYSSLNFTEVLQKAVELSTAIMAADGGTIFILDKETMLLKPLVTIDERYKDQLNTIYLKIGEGITGKAAQSTTGIICNHPSQDPRTIQVPGTPIENETLISVPLTWSGEVIGVITLWSYNGKIFQQEDLEVLTIFARQTADAIENAKLFESLERAYEELSATQEQLIMAEKLKALGDMAGGVAHDFNNVLGTVLGRTQLLLKKIPDPVLQKELLIIEEVTLKGRRTVQRLQDFTHVSSRLQYSKVDLNKVILEAIETTKPAWKDTAQKTGITINMHSDLSPISIVDGSHEELKEAACNVLLNSVDALPNGGNIWVRTYMENGRVVLQIRDDGMGMDENVKNKLFFPFFSTKGKKGVGMGLAVVYGILFRHQSDISVDSSPGKGATFTFKFNAGQLDYEDDRPLESAMQPACLSVLLVDDDINLIEVVGDMIEFIGHNCRKAEGGKEALKALAADDFDLVITDLGMPEVGGWEVAGFCRDRHPGTPIILISGWGAQLDSEEALRKVDAILPKPFQLDELKATIEMVMSSSHGLSLVKNNQLT